MKSLSETWFAEGYIDFELKKYTLLAYLQEVNKYFDANKLYPQLADLIQPPLGFALAGMAQGIELA